MKDSQYFMIISLLFSISARLSTHNWAMLTLGICSIFSFFIFLICVLKGE